MVSNIYLSVVKVYTARPVIFDVAGLKIISNSPWVFPPGVSDLFTVRFGLPLHVTVHASTLMELQVFQSLKKLKNTVNFNKKYPNVIITFLECNSST